MNIYIRNLVLLVVSVILMKIYIMLFINIGIRIFLVLFWRR